MEALSKIHHVAIVVSDLKKSVKWYMTSFQCRPVFESPQEVVLAFENIYLSLILPSHEPSHIALEREDANTLGELRERKNGVLSTFLADPTGNVVEIIARPSLGKPTSDGSTS